MTNFRIFCFVFLAMIVCAVERPVLAVTVHTEAIENIRENGVDYEVRIQGTWYEYANDEDCGNPAHKTVKGGRYFAHCHTFYSFPVYGYEVKTNAFMNVTNDNVQAYWDHRYNGVYGGTPNPKYNCWSYAFGLNVNSGYYDVWIQDPTYIYQDDYITTVYPSTRTVIREPKHAISVYETYSTPTYPNGYVRITYEKNRSSGIYPKFYYPDLPSPPHPPYPYGNTIFYRKKI